MAAVTIAFRLRDSESDSKLDPVFITIPDGQTLVQMQNIVDNAIDIIEAAVPGYVEDVDGVLQFANTASGGGPVVGNTYNERGAVFLFNTTGPRNESVRLPQIDPALMSGDDVNLAQAAITAFTEMFTVGINNGTVAVLPDTPYGYKFSAPLRGRKSGRKW